MEGSSQHSEVGLEPSVGSVGVSCDHALAETVNGLYKAEVIHRRGPWRSMEAVEFATLEWGARCNRRPNSRPFRGRPQARRARLATLGACGRSILHPR
jgi:putative transposase